MKQIVSYGAGTNSTAMVCEMVRRGEPIDAIVFCDTGGERPETYAHILDFNRWLEAKGYPQVLTIKRAPAKVFDREAATLEEECLMRRQLPGIAYGFGSCSDKWKQRPFKTWLKTTSGGHAYVIDGPSPCLCWRRGSKEEVKKHAESCEKQINSRHHPKPGWQAKRERKTNRPD